MDHSQPSNRVRSVTNFKSISSSRQERFDPSDSTTEQQQQQPLEHSGTLGEDIDDEDTVARTPPRNYRHTKKSHIYTEIIEHQNSSKTHDPTSCTGCSSCCNYTSTNTTGRIRSSNMTFAALAVLSAMFAGLIVSVRTILQTHHPSWHRQVKARLAFQPNLTFKVLQLTDLHYGENPYTDWGPVQDSNTTRLIHSMIQQEQPIDLIVVSGDQITANNINGNATVYYEQLCQLLEYYTIPYAFIFGNHDDAVYEPPPTTSMHDNDDTDTEMVFNTTLRHELMDYISHRSTTKSYLSLSQAGPNHINVVSNYVLNVFNRTVGGSNDQTNNTRVVVLQILLLDSGGGSIHEEIVYNQLAWYQQQRIPRTTMPVGTSTSYVDAIAFQHIPTQQFRYVTSSSLDRTIGSDGSRHPQPICYGMNGENGIAPLQYDTSNEVQFLSNNDTSLHFLGVGHNHGNSYCCRSSDSDPFNQTSSSTPTTTTTMSNNSSTSSTSKVPLHLCFGRHSGYGGYGLWDRGARVYELTLHDGNNEYLSYNSPRVTWKSWVRLENGTVTDMYDPFQ